MSLAICVVGLRVSVAPVLFTKFSFDKGGVGEPQIEYLDEAGHNRNSAGTNAG